MKSIMKFVAVLLVVLVFVSFFLSVKSCNSAKKDLAKTKENLAKAAEEYESTLARLKVKEVQLLTEVANSEKTISDQKKQIDELRKDHLVALDSWKYWERKYKASNSLADCDEAVKALKVDLSIKTDESSLLAFNLNLCEEASQKLKDVIELKDEKHSALEKKCAVQSQSIGRMEKIIDRYVNPPWWKKAGRIAAVVLAFVLGAVAAGIGG